MLKFPDRFLLAPMAGVADFPFRAICRSLGCRGAYTEMVSAKGLLYGSAGTAGLLRHEGGWLGVQLFGADEAAMARAAELVAPLGFDVLDINMGCPVHKVAGHGEGSALMRTPHLAARLVTEARASGLPVTVKIRLGWDENHKNYIEFAQGCVAAGASAVALHARTKSQGYAGKADWPAIAALKKELDVPVLASGDIFAPHDALRALEQTNADALLIARGACGDPWFFAKAHALLAGRPLVITRQQKAAAAMEHARQMLAYVRATSPAVMAQAGQTQAEQMQTQGISANLSTCGPEPKATSMPRVPSPLEPKATSMKGASPPMGSATASMQGASPPIVTSSAEIERHAVAAMRKHVAWYVKETRGAALVRGRVFEAQSLAQLDEILREWARDV